jgi:hypothetical protein
MIDKRNAVGLHMPTETSARVQAQQQDTPDEREYQTFCAALEASARGRAFLAEFARRNCNSDTGPLLAAVERMRSSLAVDTAEPGEALIKQKLRALLDDIDAAQSELEANIQATRSAKLAELVALVGRRIADIMTPAQVATAPEEATEVPAGRDQSAEEPRAHLAVVPVPEQPELPIPAPASAQVPPITLVHTTDAAMAEVGFVNDLPAPENTVPPGATEAPEPALLDDTPPANPFASIMALSDEERLAMFT